MKKIFFLLVYLAAGCTMIYSMEIQMNMKRKYDKLSHSNSFKEKHTAKKQRSENQYSCKLCNYQRSFSTQRGLTRHHKYSHAEILDVCTILSNLDDHIEQAVEQPARMSQCKLCGNKVSRENFTTHAQTHAVELRSIKRIKPLKKVISLNSPTVILEFHGTDSYKEHLATHKKEDEYKCHGCDKFFSTAYGCNQHYRHTHVEKKGYCNACDKGFTTKNNGKAHSKSCNKKRTLIYNSVASIITPLIVSEPTLLQPFKQTTTITMSLAETFAKNFIEKSAISVEIEKKTLSFLNEAYCT